MNLDGLLEDSQANVRVGFRPISTDARRALKQEILPSKPAGYGVEDFVQEMTAQLRTALKDKDDWYTRLIRYKAIDQVDESFFDDLIYVLAEWAQTQGAAKEDVADTPQPVSEAKSDVQVLRDSLVHALRPETHFTPWTLTSSLNEIFTRHGVQAKAQVVPAPLDKLSTSDPRSKKTRFLVAVLVGEGFTPTQVDLRHFPGSGWYDPLGIGSPEKSAKTLLGHVVEQMF